MPAPHVPAVRGRLRVVAALVSLAALAGCAGLGQPAAYDQPGINGLVIPTPSPDADDFVDVVDNPWLAFEPGGAWHYQVVEGGRELGTIDSAVVAGTTEVAGLTATGVRTVTDVDGENTDETRFYAQDDAGNVWLVGIDSDAGLSWRAGVDGAEAGLAMPAQPRLGDGWLTYRVPNLLEASTMVEDLSSEMVQMLESTGGETDAVRRTYAPGVGLLEIEDLDAGWQTRLVRE